MSTRSDYRKLTKLIEAFNQLKKEILPEKDAKGDKLEAQKNKLTALVRGIKDDIALLQNMTNDRDIIERKTELRKRFTDSQEDIKKFGDLLKKAAKEKPKDPKAHAKKIKQYHQWLELTQQEIMQLAEDARAVNVGDVGVDFGAKQVDRREDRRNKRKQRRDRRRQRGGGDDDEDYGMDEGGIYMDDIQAASEQEQAFIAKVEQARQEEEEMLNLIADGLAELHDLALTLNKLLKQSSALIDTVDAKMDKVQARFDNTNKRLEEMLEQSGGLNRWCPICICLMVLLACAGFIVSKFM